MSNSAMAADEPVPLSWTNVYVQFSLPESERIALDQYLLKRNVSLGLIFQRSLIECLKEAGIDPDDMRRPPDVHGDHDHHH